MNIEHTCGTVGEHCKITGNWIAQVVEKSIRIDPTTCVETLMETTKENHGVDVPKMMAYRVKRKCLQVVLGDHVEQYKRIIDYTNPGSRCIVTTRVS
jgi:hypothetical protein